MNENQEATTHKEIDWKSLIPPKFLYINNDPKRREKIEKKYGKSYSELDPINDKIDDSDLVIMLGGLKHLLKLRGYKSVQYKIAESNTEYASVNCSIVFTGNLETGGQDIEYSDNACAHLNNTTNFAKQYLLEMATNRALCRTIRSFLNINVVSKEELSDNSGSMEENNQSSNIDSQVSALIEKLEKEMAKKHISFEQLKNVILIKKDKLEGAENFKSLRDIPRDKLFNLYDRIKNTKVENKEGKE